MRRGGFRAGVLEPLDEDVIDAEPRRRKVPTVSARLGPLRRSERASLILAIAERHTLHDYRERFLAQDVEATLRTSMPRRDKHWSPRLARTREPRTGAASFAISQEPVFQTARTYAPFTTLSRTWKIWLTASDIYNARALSSQPMSERFAPPGSGPLTTVRSSLMRRRLRALRPCAFEPIDVARERSGLRLCQAVLAHPRHRPIPTRSCGCRRCRGACNIPRG